MNLAFLASFITLILIISINIKRQARSSQKKEEAFWAREHQANFIRRKPLDDLNYITIPLETFPTHLLQDNERVLDCIDTLGNLCAQKIVNFTGYTNTDLKIEYGTANITALMEYDQNYTLLVRTLQEWADILIKEGYPKEASCIMEFAISTRTDVSRTYYQLADYYASQGRETEIRRLADVAAGLHTSSRNIILRHLRDLYPDQV